ncbi:MAG: nuclear transport factor 2 family protein [Rhizomicrobium sp.]
MKKTAVSRRSLFEAGAGIVAAAAIIHGVAGAQTQTGLSPENEALIRRWYKSWETKDWHPLDMMLADDFTFTSAAGDDHISKSAFKKQCWETQIDYIKGMDLLRIYGSNDDAFVLYVCSTRNGRTFRNVEYLKLRNQQIEAIECYFGAPSSFPSAVSKVPA